MRLICLIRGHRWHSLTRTCTRCHQPNEILMLVDAISEAIGPLRQLATAQTEAVNVAMDANRATREQSYSTIGAHHQIVLTQRDLITEIRGVITTVTPLVNTVNEYVTRVSADTWSTGVKPVLEVLQSLTDEEQAMLEIARVNARVRNALPRKYADMLDQEDAELQGLPQE